MDRVNMDELFTSQPDKVDDYYVILGCDELSNVSIKLHIYDLLCP